MGKISSLGTPAAPTAQIGTNTFLALLNSNKDEIQSQLIAKRLIDKGTIANYFHCSAERTAKDPSLAWKCCYQITTTLTVNQWRNRYITNTNYYLMQSNQICLTQSSKADYLLNQTTNALSKGPVNVRAKIWTFYHYRTGKMHLIYSPGTAANKFNELGNYDLEFVDFVQFLHPSEAARGFYENDNEQTHHGYFSTTAFIYLNRTTDPLSSNPELRTGGQYSYIPGVNHHAMWGTDARRREWQNMGGNALMFQINDQRKGHKKGSRFSGGPYSTYPFLSDGLYSMVFLNSLNKSSYNFCMVSFSMSEALYTSNKYGLLVCMETEMQNRGIIPSDVRIINPEQSRLNSVNFGCGDGWVYPGQGLRCGVIGSFFELELSNTFTPNALFASDANNQLLKLPAPKVDEKSKPVRRYIKVTRLSHETLSGLINKKISLQKITEVIPQSFSYPFSSIVGTKIDSRAFSQVPTRTFECKLKKILVPSNYFVNNDLNIDVRYLNEPGLTQIYVGDWDGTFKLAWSNNPAWILMDLLINKRYGLGNFIESEQVDIWELYKISRWCDGVDDNGYYYGVPDSYGGTEPRHTFNALIQDRFNIFDMINQIASVFRGHVYYMNSLITFDDDRLKPIIGEFNNSDVKDGLFNYTNKRKDEEFTVLDVSYMDEKDNYKPKLEYIEDSDAISKRGILKKEINAFGITSRGQARRFGYHFLYQSSKENLNVTFVTDLKALLYKPGDLITIHDELMNSNKNYGSIKEIKDINNSCFEVVIDKILDKNIYDTKEISIFTPIAKPKFDDIATACQFIPTAINIKLSKLISLYTYNDFYNEYPGGMPVSVHLNTFTTFKPIGSIDIDSGAQKFEGTATVCKYKGFGVPGTRDTTALPQQTVSACLYYIKNYDIYNISSQYGHWALCMQNVGCILFDTIANPTLKYQLPHKLYFFEYFDAVTMAGAPYDSQRITDLNMSNISFQVVDYTTPKISYLDILENDRSSIETFYIKDYVTGNLKINNDLYNEYTCLTLYKGGLAESSSTYESNVLCTIEIGEDPNQYVHFELGTAAFYRTAYSKVNDVSITGLASFCACFTNPTKAGLPATQIFDYTNNSERFWRWNLIIRNKNSSYLDGYAAYPYAKLSFKYLDNSLKDKNITSEFISTNNKDYIKDNICDLMVGSSYSLKILNKNSKIFKIMSITENYVNEYSIMASEFNPNRFKEIEENNSVDDLATTFNSSYIHNTTTSINTAGQLKSPVIFVEPNGGNLHIKWRPVAGANIYKLFIRTPSKLTRDYIQDIDYNSYHYNEALNLFSVYWGLPFIKEIGTYTVSLEAVQTATLNSMYKFSPPAYYSVTVLSY